MSTTIAPPLDRETRPPRILPRFNIALSLDVTVLRSGIADKIPGRSVDISDGGLGLVVAGELSVGESVAVEFWLPRLEEPLKARARVRHHNQLRCGIEFVGLTGEQQALIHSWTRHKGGSQPYSTASLRAPEKYLPAKAVTSRRKTKRLAQKFRRYRFRIALIVLLAASLGWWRWQSGWTEIERQLPTKQGEIQPEIMVPSAEMEQRITHKVDPVYPEAARQEHLKGVVVLHAVIGADGAVLKLQTVSGPAPLVQAAIDAARWWRYEPYLLNGRAVQVETNLEVPFGDYRVSMTQ
jgi:TonB family protein